MKNTERKISEFQAPQGISAYDDEGVTPGSLSQQQRIENADQVIHRFFVSDNVKHALEREVAMRSINPGPNFTDRLQEVMELASGGFGTELPAPSKIVEEAFRDYAETDLGAVAIARLLEWDNRFIALGWRNRDGSLSEAGIKAYGEGKWRPLRIASHGDGGDAVTQSGVLLLPDIFVQEYYSTGDISDPLAILHHEIKAHILPLKEAKGLVPGREMGLICMRLESEMLQELGMPGRKLNWGLDEGTLDHTLHEPNEKYYRGLVRYDNGRLVEVEPETERVLGLARVIN